MPKNAVFFDCSSCDFKCSKQSNFTKHLQTRKHFININQQTFCDEKQRSIFTCENCSAKYKERTGLWRHLKICVKPEIDPPNICGSLHNNELNNFPTVPTIYHDNAAHIPHLKPNENTNTNTTFESCAVAHDSGSVNTPGFASTPLHPLMLEFLKHNTEFKELLIEQNKTIIELASKTGNNNNTINNNFNINVFLNDTCKDAIDINEFIKDMQITNDELEQVGRNGYVSGITDIIVSRIKKLDIAKRPLHCTDMKREIIYIRNENVWNKDSDDNSQLRKVIRRIADKNLSKIPEWRDQHPECENNEHAQYDFYINLFRNSLGDIGDEQIRLDTKIIKHIAKLVMIDKNWKNITN